jgi:hypothetical protein
VPEILKTIYYFAAAFPDFSLGSGQFSGISISTSKLMPKTLDKIFEIDYNPYNETKPCDDSTVLTRTADNDDHYCGGAGSNGHHLVYWRDRAPWW